MAKEKVVYQKAITPKGTLIYPWLTKADTKFNPSGEFRTTLAIPAEQCEEFAKKLDSILEKFYQEQVAEAKPQDKKKLAKEEPYQPQYDDEGNETGVFLFKAKLKAEITMKSGETFKQTVKLFDAQGFPLPTSVSPYGGTQAKLSVEIVPYCMPSTKKCGLSLRLKAVQVIQLVAAGGGGNSESFGFDKEDGFTCDKEERFEGTTTTTDDSEDF